ncbi:MAG: nucleoside 2-deoxyribosyltransferase [Chloroflexota bacterium]
MNDKKKIYIAGPLFTSGERWFLEIIDQICQDLGYDTYLPHRDAGLSKPTEESRRYCFEQDKKILDDVHLVVAVLNGVDLDSGTAWEIGYAHALNVPVIGVFDDKRLFNPAVQLNPMICYSIALCPTIECLKDMLIEHL